MVTMAAKWSGKCRLCGGALPPGTTIEWTKEGGARHVTPEACAEATANPSLPDPPLRGPQPQTPEEFERLKRLFLAHPWKFASTMARIPHFYTLRKQWAVDEDFVWTIEHIRRVGYQQRFGGRVYIYADVEKFCYWDCGGAVADVGLINRAVRRPEAARLGL